MQNDSVLKIAIEGMHCGCVPRGPPARAPPAGGENRPGAAGAAEGGYHAARVEPQEILDAVSGIGFPARAA